MKCCTIDCKKKKEFKMRRVSGGEDNKHIIKDDDEGAVDVAKETCGIGTLLKRNGRKEGKGCPEQLGDVAC